MHRSLLLPFAAALSLTGCDQALSTAPAAPEGPASPVDSVNRVASRLLEYHVRGYSGVEADRANASKSDPADTIQLLPPDLVVPSGVAIRWSYLGEGAFSPVDPARMRVPLRDGIVLVLEGTWYCAIHSAAGAVAPPTITPGTQVRDYFLDSIEITSPRPGALIHYTLDGTYPTTRSPLYTGPIPLDQPYLVRAMVEVPGLGASLSAVAGYPVAGGWNPAVAYDTLVDVRDGQVYPVVHIGTQTWMAGNLAWSASGGVPRDGREGGLYDVERIRTGKVCPEGWSVPSRADWDSLVAWGIRQPGVSRANFGNALRTNALRETPDENFVDLFGFRATSSSFWTRDSGGDSGTVVLRVLVGGSLEESVLPVESSRWIVGGYGQETYLATGPTTSRVRCLKD